MPRLSRFIVPISADGDADRLIALVHTATEAIYVFDERAEQTLADAVGGTLPSNHFLVAEGFVVDDGTEELEAVRSVFGEARTKPSRVQLTIVPTMACNFGCDYCFESHRKGIMSEETQAQVLEAAKRLCLEAPPSERGLSVTWFGGEPLMGISVIESITRQLADWANKHLAAMGLQTHIITNGYLLNPRMAERLLSVGISTAQITIDGPQHIHDKRRFLKTSGKGSFRTIVDNICKLPPEFSVLVRVNVDRRNDGEVLALIEQLEQHGAMDRVRLQLAPVDNYSGGCNADTVMSSREFAAFRESVQTTYESRLVGAEKYGRLVESSVIRSAVHGVCQVDHVNSYVIDVNGDLYRCWADLGTEALPVGHIRDLCAKRLPVVRDGDLRARDPFDDPECCACAFLPLCMGSCPKTRSVNRANGNKQCPSWKYEYESMVRRRIHAAVTAGRA